MRSVKLTSAAHATTRVALRELVRQMNSFYSNRIEGQNTHPRYIERALEAGGVSMDGGAADPGIVLQVHDPVACAADLVGQLGYLQRILEKVLDGQRACCESRIEL